MLLRAEPALIATDPIANTVTSAIDADLLAVGLQDVVQSQELDHRGYSASFLNALAWRSLIFFRASRTFF